MDKRKSETLGLSEWEWVEQENGNLALYDERDNLILDVDENRLLLREGYKKLLRAMPGIFHRVDTVLNESIFSDWYETNKNSMPLVAVLEIESLRLLLEEVFEDVREEN